MTTLGRLEGAHIRFDDALTLVCSNLASRGVTVNERPAAVAGVWADTIDRLQRGHPVIAIIDPFYLPYYWIDFGRTHSSHAILLTRAGRETVDAVDATDVSRFSGKIAMNDLWNAAMARDRGQTWIDVDLAGYSIPGAGNRTVEAEEGVGGFTRDETYLSARALAEVLLDDAPRILALSRRIADPDARAGLDDRRRELSRLLRGLWSVHHTMRWFGRFVGTTAAERQDVRLLEVANDIDRLAQDWLVLRNIAMKYGLASAARRDRLAQLFRDGLAAGAESADRIGRGRARAAAGSGHP